jgi:hypothetical protein
MVYIGYMETETRTGEDMATKERRIEDRRIAGEWTTTYTGTERRAMEWSEGCRKSLWVERRSS